MSAVVTGVIEASGASDEGSGGISRDGDGAAAACGGGGGAGRVAPGREDVLWTLGAAGGVCEPFCVGGGAYLGVLAVKKDLIELCWPGLLVGRDMVRDEVDWSVDLFLVVYVVGISPRAK